MIEEGEECDDGNTLDEDGCTPDCMRPICGDGYRAPNEACDDGNTLDGDGCSSTCQLPTVCGNGELEQGEACDDGNLAEGDACTPECQFPTCGDGFLGPGEECDDANYNDQDSCPSTCEVAYCGDGFTGPGEECDDANSDNADGCVDSCLLCEEKTYELVNESPPANVMLVVDASGSMVNNSWDHDLDEDTPHVTRWSSLHAVVSAITEQFGSSHAIGLQRFPSEAALSVYGAASCVTEDMPEVGLALNNAGAILSALPGASSDGEQVRGGTPATRGVVSAITHLLAQGPMSENHIVLITDGAANCNKNLMVPDLLESYDETLLSTVEDAFLVDGITTIVVGIDIVDEVVGVGQDASPEANPFERLNEVAVAGGAPKNQGDAVEKFYNVSNELELLTAIGTIFDSIGGGGAEVDDAVISGKDCVFNLPAAQQSSPAALQIEAFGQLLPGPDIDCEAQIGWTWLEPDISMILCGYYCESFLEGTTIDAKYVCSSSLP